MRDLERMGREANTQRLLPRSWGVLEQRRKTWDWKWRPKVF